MPIVSSADIYPYGLCILHWVDDFAKREDAVEAAKWVAETMGIETFVRTSTVWIIERPHARKGTKEWLDSVLTRAQERVAEFSKQKRLATYPDNYIVDD